MKLVWIPPSYGYHAHTRMDRCELHTENCHTPCNRQFTPINGTIIPPHF